MATHVLDGKSWSIGMRNCRHPFQCPINNIIQMRLNIRINIPATLRNWHTTKPHVAGYCLYVITNKIEYKNVPQLSLHKIVHCFCILSVNSLFYHDLNWPWTKLRVIGFVVWVEVCLGFFFVKRLFCLDGCCFVWYSASQQIIHQRPNATVCGFRLFISSLTIVLSDRQRRSMKSILHIVPLLKHFCNGILDRKLAKMWPQNEQENNKAAEL